MRCNIKNIYIYIYTYIHTHIHICMNTQAQWHFPHHHHHWLTLASFFLQPCSHSVGNCQFVLAVFAKRGQSAESVQRKPKELWPQGSLSANCGLETISRKPGSNERCSRRETSRPVEPVSRRKTVIAVGQGSASLEASARLCLVCSTKASRSFPRRARLQISASSAQIGLRPAHA